MSESQADTEARRDGPSTTASRFAGPIASSAPASHPPAWQPAPTLAAPIRLVVADDSYLIRESLTHAFVGQARVEIVAVCSDRHALDAAIEERRPDVVMTDIRMPPSGEEEGIRAAARLRDTHPHVGVVVLSQYAEPAYALELLKSGTSRRAYLLKERLRHRGELLAAIDAVASGGSVIDPKIVELLIESRGRAESSPLADLTARELELLALIAQGKSNPAIAESLVLTKRAVEKHVNSIFFKLGLPDAHYVSRRVMAALIFLSEHEQ
jgi:DNA-binding NarL/FixJ family response regulator